MKSSNLSFAIVTIAVILACSSYTVNSIPTVKEVTYAYRANSTHSMPANFDLDVSMAVYAAPGPNIAIKEMSYASRVCVIPTTPICFAKFLDETIAQVWQGTFRQSKKLL